MLTTRRIFSAMALAVLVAACAQPTPYTPVASAAGAGPVQLAAENIAFDVSGVSEAEVINAALSSNSAVMATGPTGRPVAAVVSIREFTFVDRLFSSVFGSFTTMSGDVAVNDLATGEPLFVTERIELDTRSLAIPESGIQTQDRVTVEVHKLSRLFMQRARQALLASNT